jgi:predicted RND superfamily exporter protein
VSRQFAHWFSWTVDHRGWTAAGVVVMTVLATIGVFDPEFFDRLFRPAAEVVAVASSEAGERRTPEVTPFSFSGADVVLVVQADEFFTPAGAAAIREVVDSLESSDLVEEVVWLDSLPPLNIFGLREPVFPPSTATPGQFAMARQKALTNPLAGGQLLSLDGRTLLLLVHVDWLGVETDADVSRGIKGLAEAAAARHPEAGFSFLSTGPAPMYVTYMESQASSRFKYQVIGYVLIAGLSIVLFRGFSAVLIVAIAPMLGVFWTTGALGLIGIRDNPFNDIVLPILVSLIGLTDGVHLMLETRRQRVAGLRERDAARAGVGIVGLACFITAVTTAVGFGSLGFAHHELVREFGWSCMLGVALTFLAVITTIPVVSSSWLGRNVHHGHERNLIDRNLGRVGLVIDYSIRHSRWVMPAGFAVTALLGAIALTLEPDERRSTSLPRGSEALVALETMDEAFGGLERAQVVIRWSDDIDAHSPETYEVARQVREVLRSQELIARPLSIVDLLEALPGDDNAAARMSMVDLLPPPLKQAFYRPEERWTEVAFRVRDLGIKAYGKIFTRVQEELQKIETQHPGYSVQLAGDAVHRWENLYQIVVDLASSLGSETIIVFGILMLVYRSVRLGLIAAVPNLFPLVVTAAWLVATGDSLEMVHVCAFSVSLGIAVDDTIHFLTRYLEERPGNDRPTAIRQAFVKTGTGMIMTTIVLITGFVTVLFSELREQRIFASMSCITFAAALFGDLFFLPAILDRLGGNVGATTPELAPEELES